LTKTSSNLKYSFISENEEQNDDKLRHTKKKTSCTRYLSLNKLKLDILFTSDIFYYHSLVIHSHLTAARIGSNVNNKSTYIFTTSLGIIFPAILVSKNRELPNVIDPMLYDKNVDIKLSAHDAFLE